jgi:formylglycine-generating enzyme required for sulfatase activity
MIHRIFFIAKRFRNRLGMDFVRIPEGSFMMGSPPDEPGREDDEKQHEVRISKPFYLQTTEV